MTPHARIKECARVIRETLLTRKGEVIDEALAEERANNAATGLYNVLWDDDPRAIPAVDPYIAAEAAIRHAITRVRGLKIHVRPGTVGITRGEYSDLWSKDPGERGVSAIGAYLLGKTTEEDAPYVAASDLLGVSNAWCDGADAGWNQDPDIKWIGAAAESLYSAGFRCGVRLRQEFLR